MPRADDNESFLGKQEVTAADHSQTGAFRGIPLRTIRLRGSSRAPDTLAMEDPSARPGRIPTGNPKLQVSRGESMTYNRG